MNDYIPWILLGIFAILTWGVAISKSFNSFREEQREWLKRREETVEERKQRLGRH